MRCPSCGTENAPDSRFCGGCGARVSGVENRVAPTAKISSDAKYADPPTASMLPAVAAAQQVGAARAQSVPPLMPEPIAVAPRAASVAPRMASVPPIAAVAAVAPVAAPIETPSLSRSPSHSPSLSAGVGPPKRRAWIGVVVVVDLALAGAGAWMMQQGMQREAAAGTSKTTTTDASAGSGSGSAIAVASGPAALTMPGTRPTTGSAPDEHHAVAAVLAGSGSSVGSGSGSSNGSGNGSSNGSGNGSSNGNGSGNGSGSASASASASGSGSAIAGGSGAPLDPYAGSAADPSAEVAADLDSVASKSKPIFDHCYLQATKSLPADQALAGNLKIAFQVLSDGRIAHATAIENTTGSDQLASCMVHEVGGWVLHPHDGAPADFVRQFSFQAQQ